jgi:hypothetical protein
MKDTHWKRRDLFRIFEKRKQKNNLRKLVEEYNNDNVSSMAKEMLSGLLQLLLLLAVFGLITITTLSVLIIVLGYIYAP